MSNDTYPPGQCTRYVADNWSQQVGPYWGDGWMWLGSGEQAGYATTSVPSVGAIAVWGRDMGGARAAGHVAIVQAAEPLTVAESNWNIALQPDQRVVSSASAAGIVGYLLPEKADPPMTYSLDQQRVKIHEAYWTYLLREVENDAAMQYHLGVWNTKGMEACLAEIWDGSEHGAVVAAQRKLLGLG
jgi:surface antigen